MALKKHKKSERHIQIPHRILNDPQFIKLKQSAKGLMLDVLMQYNGKNNGDLQMTREYLMKQRGWRSAGTINTAKKALLKSGLVVETRSSFFGQSGKSCCRFAIAWLQSHYLDGVELTHAKPPTWKPQEQKLPVQKSDA